MKKISGLSSLSLFICFSSFAGSHELEVAACSKDVAGIEREIQNGSMVTDKAVSCLVCVEDLTSSLDLLLAHGGNPSARYYSSGMTVLDEAVHYDCLKTATVLISYGADRTFNSSDGRTLLMWSAYNGVKA
jgi:hypothetical protein